MLFGFGWFLTSQVLDVLPVVTIYAYAANYYDESEQGQEGSRRV